MSGGKKRGPKGERYDDSKALSAMVPLIRKGMSDLSATTRVVRQGLADSATKQNEAATIERVRRKFRGARKTLMARRQPVNSAHSVGGVASPDFLGVYWAAQSQDLALQSCLIDHTAIAAAAFLHNPASLQQSALRDSVVAGSVIRADVDRYLLTVTPLDEIMSKAGLRRR